MAGDVELSLRVFDRRGLSSPVIDFRPAERSWGLRLRWRRHRSSVCLVSFDRLNAVATALWPWEFRGVARKVVEGLGCRVTQLVEVRSGPLGFGGRSTVE